MLYWAWGNFFFHFANSDFIENLCWNYQNLKTFSCCCSCCCSVSFVLCHVWWPIFINIYSSFALFLVFCFCFCFGHPPFYFVFVVLLYILLFNMMVNKIWIWKNKVSKITNTTLFIFVSPKIMMWLLILLTRIKFWHKSMRNALYNMRRSIWSEFKT